MIEGLSLTPCSSNQCHSVPNQLYFGPTASEEQLLLLCQPILSQFASHCHTNLSLLGPCSVRLSKLQSTVHIVYFASVVLRVTRGDDPHFKIIYSVKISYCSLVCSMNFFCRKLTWILFLNFECSYSLAWLDH